MIPFVLFTKRYHKMRFQSISKISSILKKIIRENFFQHLSTLVTIKLNLLMKQNLREKCILWIYIDRCWM